MKLTLGFSPCPNDTFIFDALIHHKIDTEGLEFDVCYDDVETLNQKAFRGELDITKLSFHTYAYVLAQYVLLDAGSALGFGVGPMLIAGKNSKFKIQNSDSKNPHLTTYNSQPATQNPQLTTDNSQPATNIQPKIGIPGKYTTANFLLSAAFPHLQNRQEMLFSDIENALLNGEIDLGLIIHENRFTYQDKGLKKIIDLGEYWEQTTGCAIPLGGIVIKRNLANDVKQKVNRLVRKSVEFAFKNPKSALEFIRSHAQEMSEEVMYKHIDLYVNKYSIALGEEGRKAVKLLFENASKSGAIPAVQDELFLTN